MIISLWIKGGRIPVSKSKSHRTVKTRLIHECRFSRVCVGSIATVLRSSCNTVFVCIFLKNPILESGPVAGFCSKIIKDSNWNGLFRKGYHIFTSSLSENVSNSSRVLLVQMFSKWKTIFSLYRGCVI